MTAPEVRAALPLDAAALDRLEQHGPDECGDDYLALFVQSRAALALQAECERLRETNAKLNRRAQAAESIAGRCEKIEQRIAEHKRGKPLGRIDGAFAIAAAETAADSLRDERDALLVHVERLREALDHATDYIAGGFIYGRPADGQDPLDMLKDRLLAALSSTPAQSLAALRARVRAEAFREAADTADSEAVYLAARGSGPRSAQSIIDVRDVQRAAKAAILALAAQEGANDA